MDLKFRERIGRIIDAVGNAQRLAALTGISASAIGKYSRGEGDITRVNMVAIGDATGFSVQWMATGRGPEKEGGLEGGDYVMIRRADVQASAGEGTIIYSEDELTPVPFRAEHIKRLRTDPNNLTVIEVRGESMTPTLSPGDEVMVDLTAGQTYVDGIYAVRINNTLMVKRVQQLPDERLIVTSDNPAYQSFEVGMEEEGVGNFAMVGRVVWAGRRY